MGNFSNYWDLHTLFTKLKNKLKSISDKIDDSVSLKTATGNPITLTDAANANAEELSMTIEPIQSGSGDPSPTNVRPISGLTEGKVVACGKNIVHIDSTKIFNTNKNPSDPITGIADGMLILSTASNGYIRIEHLASYTINNPNSITAKIVDNGTYGVGIVVEIDDSKTYTLNLVKTGGSVRIGWLNNDGSNLSYTEGQTLPCNLTPPSGAKYLMIVCCPGRNAEHTFSNIQLEEGATPTAYEPYTAATATITFGQTVYGGSVNFKTGEVTVTHGYHKITSSDEIIKSGASGIQSGRAGYWLGHETSWLAEIKFSGGDTNPNHISMISNCYDIGTTSTLQVVEANNFAVGIGMASGLSDKVTNLWFNVSATDCPDIQSFINWITSINFEVVYPLATPRTLTLTPAELELLKGNNTITANGVEISIEYYPDNAIGALAGRVDGKADEEDVATALAKKDNITTVEIPRFITSQAGWRRICKIKPVDLQTAEGIIYAGGFWSNGQPPSATVAVSLMVSVGSLTLLSSAFAGDKRITAMRLINATGAEFWLDAYFPAYSSLPGPFKFKFTGDIAVSDIQNPISITTDATAATDEISLNQKVSGTVLTDKSIVDISSQATVDTSKVSSFKAYTYGKIIYISLVLKPGVTDQTNVIAGLPNILPNIDGNYGVLPMFHMNAADASSNGVCAYVGTNIQYRGSTTTGKSGTVYSGMFLLA